VRTNVITTSTPEERAKAHSEAAELLRKGETVALPTETVYGLAADSLSPLAVVKVFEAKGRPRFNPLIIHLPDRTWLEKIAVLPRPDRQLILKLAEEFWPGPFTMILPKRRIVPEIVTAGLDTVAVRISAHPVFSQIVQAFAKPVAAPSANRFGRVSPTTAQHVLNELKGRISLIVDAGPTQHGIESTIIAIRDGKIGILRRGPVTSEQLSAFASIDIVTSGKSISAPGQLPSHYAPKTPLQLIDHARSFSAKSSQRCALLAWNVTEEDKRFVAIRYLSQHQELHQAAANLFRHLRELDELNVDLIVAERVPSHGLGAAINDRLQRAAAK